MSKPDPSITANLLGTLTAKPTQEGHEGLKPGKPGHAERHPAPTTHKPSKPAPNKQASAHTRSTNRGK